MSNAVVKTENVNGRQATVLSMNMSLTPRFSATQRRYLDLLRMALTDTLHNEGVEYHPLTASTSVKEWLLQFLNTCLVSGGHAVVRVETSDLEKRAIGAIWPRRAETMVGVERLKNLELLVSDCIAREVEGDLIETGVWRGGATIFINGILQALNAGERKLWVADSFAGLPKPDAEKYPQDAGDLHHTRTQLAISLEEVKANFERYGLLTDNVVFLKGWFKDTLPLAPIEKLALIRLDGDMFESTMDGLVNLYPKLSPGGYIVIDDYGAIPQCAAAVEQYRQEHSISQEMIGIDWTGVYWQKQE